MQKQIPVLSLFTLVSLSFLTTDVLLTDRALRLLGEHRAVLAYSSAMLMLGVGFSLFPLLYRSAARRTTKDAAGRGLSYQRYRAAVSYYDA